MELPLHFLKCPMQPCTCPSPTLKFGAGVLKASSWSNSFLKSVVISLSWFLNFLETIYPHSWTALPLTPISNAARPGIGNERSSGRSRPGNPSSRNRRRCHHQSFRMWFRENVQNHHSFPLYIPFSTQLKQCPLKRFYSVIVISNWSKH